METGPENIQTAQCRWCSQRPPKVGLLGMGQVDTEGGIHSA